MLFPVFSLFLSSVQAVTVKQLQTERKGNRVKYSLKYTEKITNSFTAVYFCTCSCLRSNLQTDEAAEKIEHDWESAGQNEHWYIIHQSLHQSVSSEVMRWWWCWFLDRDFWHCKGNMTAAIDTYPMCNISEYTTLILIYVYSVIFYSILYISFILSYFILSLYFYLYMTSAVNATYAMTAELTWFSCPTHFMVSLTLC